MINEISDRMLESLKFSKEDKIIFNGKLVEVEESRFNEIEPGSEKIVGFVDGGEAEIISAGNFCLSFIRIFAPVFKGCTKIKFLRNEFYLFCKAKYLGDDIFYESQIFQVEGEKLVEEGDLFINSNDQTIRAGLERASIGKVVNMARRLAELKMANNVSQEVDFVLVDGSLEKTFHNEEKYLDLPRNVCALAKTSSLFTVNGNNPMVLLNQIGPEGCWNYFIDETTRFVKLHGRSKHVFRFRGDCSVLGSLIRNSEDALFLGYPYGLILADQMARISNVEKSSLKTKFLLRMENKQIVEYLNSSNAHDILDNLG